MAASNRTRPIMSALLTTALAAAVLVPAAPTAQAQAGSDYDWGLASSLLQDSYGAIWGDTTRSIAYWGYEFDADYTFYLAKDEREGFQVFFWPKTDGGSARSLRVEVSNFTHSNGADQLVPTVFREIYVGIEPNVDTARWVDPLVPYAGEYLNVDATTAVGWYIELVTTPETAPGDYRAQVKLYEQGSSTPLETGVATAHVWDFTLPEDQYADTTFGNYNSNSGYWDTSALVQWACGTTGDKDPMQDDPECANSVVKAWYDLLLEHGMSGYELPYGLVDSDPRAFAKYALNPKVTTFTVPFADGSDGATIRKYRDIVGQWPETLEKAYFYVQDEKGYCPSCETADAYQTYLDSVTSEIAPRVDLITSNWDDPNIMVTTGWSKDWHEPLLLDMYQGYGVKTMTVLTSKVAADYDGYVDLRDALRADGGQAWFYPGETPYTTTDLWSAGRPYAGTMRRQMYWQMFYFGAEGVLDWQTSMWRVSAGHALFNPWEKNSVTNTGDGQYIYPPLSNDPTALVGSLRLKNLADGIDDYDYFKLAEQFISPDFANTQLRKLLRDQGAGPGSVMAFTSGGWGTNTIEPFVDNVAAVRKTIGDALEAANLDEKWEASCGQWQQYLAPTATDTGLELRTCNSGLQESREIPVVEAVEICTGTLAITGVPNVGWELATKGLDCGDAQLSYSWAPGADGLTSQPTYRPIGSDLGKKVTVTVTATKASHTEQHTASTARQVRYFNDVDTHQRFAESINQLAAAGIVSNTGEYFWTDRELTRAQAAAYLYRMAGRPAFTRPSAATFSDVPKTHTFSLDIEWAYAAGLLKGKGAGTYQPDAPVTRAEAVTYLHRLETLLYGARSYSTVTPHFKDVPKTHTFYWDVEWALAAGVTQPNVDFHPDRNCLRDEFAGLAARWVNAAGN
ncbi:MAG: S-layer homology domain-containing protein [Propionibacteriaceae bacterium]|jgi:hypothetical protein|nr:S-layer homology domain-containing protein [Propionibacteriaceae bacterium]